MVALENGTKKEISGASKILKKAANFGFEILKNDGSALDAVEKAINILEDSGLFNAGIGSCKQSDGRTRMDASIMDGKNLRCGAVAAIENIKNPISVARKVMEKTNHVLLVSKLATDFAKKIGFECIKFKQKHERKEETVGAVALDKFGSLAAGTSSGGLSCEMLPGRVGDSALIGCGTYANEFAAVSATGIGEAIIKTTLARRCCEYVEAGLSPQKAAGKAIKYLENKTKLNAGLIVIDRNGKYGAYHNTKRMLWCKGS